MGIKHARLGARGDEARIPGVIAEAYAQSHPFVFLVTRSPQ
jgi:hypothetical protein